MFSLDVVKTLDKFSYILLIPLVTIAIRIDFPFHNSPDLGTSINWIAGLMWSFILALIAIQLVDYAIVWLDVYHFENSAFAFAGLAFLTFCLYGASIFCHQLPPSPFNPAWHLAAGCYGFTFFKRNELIKSATST